MFTKPIWKHKQLRTKLRTDSGQGLNGQRRAEPFSLSIMSRSSRLVWISCKTASTCRAIRSKSSSGNVSQNLFHRSNVLPINFLIGMLSSFLLKRRSWTLILSYTWFLFLNLFSRYSVLRLHSPMPRYNYPDFLKLGHPGILSYLLLHRCLNGVPRLTAWSEKSSLCP